MNTPFPFRGSLGIILTMSVTLRDVRRGLYFAGPGCWVKDPAKALDLGTVERAVEMARAEDVGDLEIVAGFGTPECELVFPVRFSTGNRGTDRRPDPPVSDGREGRAWPSP